MKDLNFLQITIKASVAELNFVKFLVLANSTEYHWVDVFKL